MWKQKLLFQKSSGQNWSRETRYCSNSYILYLCARTFFGVQLI